jgi:hypothetical protein
MGTGATFTLTLLGMIVLWCVHAKNRVFPYRVTYASATIHLETQLSALRQALSNSPLWVTSEAELRLKDAPSLLRWVRVNNFHESEGSGAVARNAERVIFAIQQSNAAHRALHQLLSNPRFLPDLLISGPIKGAPIDELQVLSIPIRGFA